MLPRLLAFSGSLRRASFNHLLVEAAAAGARAAGAEATVIRLADFALPVFNEDDEKASGMPSAAQALKKLFLEHDGLLIASPEYNSGYTAALKNAFDWVSRGAPGEAPLSAYRGKTAGLVAASPGALGGLRGLVQVRMLLGNLGVLVVPDQFALSKAHEAFDADGRMKDDKARAAVEGVGRAVAATAARLKG
jgi:chromate reductase